MKNKNLLDLGRIIGKIDNDFNISESDWIPRVAAWVTDALSQMKVLPMTRKRRILEVSDKIAQFPCQLNTTDILESQNAGFQKILDFLANDKIDSLRSELQSAQLQLSLLF